MPGGLAVHATGHDHELLAAIAGKKIRPALKTLGQGLGDIDQRLVALLVPEVVVVGLEMVDIDEKDRHRLRGARGDLPERAQPAVEMTPVVDAGQRIERDQLFERALGRLQVAIACPQLLVEQHALGDVLLETDVMRDRAILVMNRRHAQLVPEQGAVLAVVRQHFGKAFALGHRRTHDPALTGVDRPALEKTAVATDRIIVVVAGHALESGIDEDERGIDLTRVGDGNTVTRVHHGVLQQFEIDHQVYISHTRRRS